MSSPPSKPCRLLAVNGPVQVLAAVAALQTKEATLPAALRVPVVLGIQPLHTQDAARSRSLEQMIRECAHALHAWDAVVDLREGATQFEAHGFVPVEVFVNMIEVPESRVLFQRWPQAKRVLYGDGLGLAQTTSDFGPARSRLSEVRHWLGRFLPFLRHQGDAEGSEHCEEAYILARHPTYDLRCSRQQFIPASHYRSLFEKLASCLSSPALDAAMARLPEGGACDVLLMTNLPGAPATDADAEVVAYVSLLTEGARTLAPAVWVKPHPRNSSALLSRLRELLGGHYPSVIVFDTPEEAALPFEIVLGKAVATGRLQMEALNFFATSTAACSVPVVFGKAVKIGFGARACQTIYKQSAWLKSRLRHERRLSALVSDLLGAARRTPDAWSFA